MEHRDKLRVGYEGRSNTINVFKPSLTIPKLVKQSHELAKEKGFWDNPKELGTSLMLIVTELAEAFETFRCADKPENIFPTADTLSQVEKIQNDKKFFKAYQEKIKGSFPEEIADIKITIEGREIKSVKKELFS
jgi:hypothetical protein